MSKTKEEILKEIGNILDGQQYVDSQQTSGETSGAQIYMDYHNDAIDTCKKQIEIYLPALLDEYAQQVSEGFHLWYKKIKSERPHFDLNMDFEELFTQFKKQQS